MTHTYKISGMGCAHCATKVKQALESHPEISEVTVSRDPDKAVVTMKQHVQTDMLQSALEKVGGYKIEES